MDYYTITKKTNGVIEVKETFSNGSFVIKHYICQNSDNFVLKFVESNQRLNLSLFELNGTKYVNVNSEHIIEFFKFVKVVHMYNTCNCCKNSTCVAITGHNLCYNIHNCTVELFKKGIKCVTDNVKHKSLWY